MKSLWSWRVSDPRVWAFLAVVGLFVFGATRPAQSHDNDNDDDESDKYLYIWAGHVDHSACRAGLESAE